MRSPSLPLALVPPYRFIPLLPNLTACSFQVYAFSAENWGRDAAETNFLMQLMTRVIKRDTPELAAQGVRMRFIGELEGLPRQLQNQIAR